MGEVKRYDFGGMYGDYVLHSDYATLEARSEALEKERDALTQKLKASEAEVAQIGSYCQTLTDAKVELAAELGEAQAEVEKLRDDAALHDETLEICNKQFASLRAEVERLSAACAAKDAALSKALGYVDFDNPDLISKCLAALKDDAGKGWVDASGAVEAGITFLGGCGGAPAQYVASAFIPVHWAGSKVLIVRVKP